MDYLQEKKNKRNTVFFVAFIAALIAFLNVYIVKWILGENNSTSSFIAFYCGLSLISIISIIITYVKSPEINVSATGAELADPNTYGKQIRMLDNMCLGYGITTPPKLYIIQSDQINAFATGLKKEDAIICITTGCIEKLTDAQLEAVLAHELTHVQNLDIRLACVVTVLVSLISMLVNIIVYAPNSDSDSRGGGIVSAIIGLLAVILVPLFASLAQFAISRQREFLADAGAVKITRNPEALKGALLAIKNDTTNMEMPEGVSSMFLEEPDIDSRSKEGHSLWDTHPSIDERIEYINKLI